MKTKLITFLTLTFLLGLSNASAQENITTKIDISGEVPNIPDHFSVAGFRFDVLFSNITYKGQIRQISVTQTDKNKYIVQAALQNGNLHFNRTTIKGSRHSAVCGLVPVKLGTQKPVWLQFNIERKDGKLKMTRSHVSGMPNNFSVGFPNRISTSGFGMTETRVSKGIRNGLNKNQRIITSKLNEEMPDIFNQIKGQLADHLDTKKVAAK